MSNNSADASATNGVRQKEEIDPDAEVTPGGSEEPQEDPETPGGTAATHHPPAE